MDIFLIAQDCFIISYVEHIAATSCLEGTIIILQHQETWTRSKNSLGNIARAFLPGNGCRPNSFSRFRLGSRPTVDNVLAT